MTMTKSELNYFTSEIAKMFKISKEEAKEGSKEIAEILDKYFK